jgi:hypothetical protein
VEAAVAAARDPDFVALWLAASGVKTAGRRSGASSAARVGSRVAARPAETGGEAIYDERNKYAGQAGKVQTRRDRPRAAGAT